MKVFVYFNLHKKVWSVKALSGPNRGRVISHSREVCLINCEYRVSEKSRQRVLREKRKNVHAGVVGWLAPLVTARPSDAVQVTYNPYKGPKFTDLDGNPRDRADRIIMTEERRVYEV